MPDIFELFKQISKNNTKPSLPPEFLIVGLGNPGDKYFHTRHNAGFLAMDYISQKISVSVTQAKFKSLTAKAELSGHSVILMKPQTYMNHSGIAVKEAADFYKIPPENIIVIVDDIYQSPGKMRIRKNGSAGGHNGLKSIIEHLHSENFPRIRIGVGEKPSPEYDLADWVTGQIPKEDYDRMFKIFESSYEALEFIMNGQIDSAMGKFNGLSY